MHYVIDGYNLVGKIKSLSLGDPNKEKILVSFLEHRNPHIKDRFTLVFDGKCAYSPWGSKTKTGKYHIIFTAHDESADDYILGIIDKTKNKKGTTVISSDRKIQYHAKLKRILCLKSEAFLKTYRNEIVEDEKPFKASEKELDHWLNSFSDI